MRFLCQKGYHRILTAYRPKTVSAHERHFTIPAQFCAKRNMASSDESWYPEVKPYNSGFLKVSDVHELYYEESGNINGKPVVYCHGGPGAGTSVDDHRYFNPEKYRVIVFDQRGAGKSKPAAELKDNTPAHLVSDMEKLREMLGIDKWMLFGGSWGANLSLLYAETHPDRVIALVLRGIFTLRRSEVEWYFQSGCSNVFPDFWEEYIKPIPEAERGDLVAAYYKRLTGDNEQEKLACAKAWSGWEMATSRLYVDNELIQKTDSDIWSLQFARIECHFFVNRGFLETDSQVLDNVHKIGHIPCTIVQGRYDMVCPVITAWQLHKAYPASKLIILPDVGHSAKEEKTRRELVKACDEYAEL